MRRSGYLPAQTTKNMIGFFEEVHQKQRVQSAPRTLMDRWFERPDTSTIYVLTVYPPFFCTFHIDWPTERQVLAVMFWSIFLLAFAFDML
jgi:hypothetical protein